MSALSGLVRKELKRYSGALGKALASFETRPPVQDADELAGILAEVHALFEDDFLDRLEPSGWIQPLFELALVPQSVRLMAFILATHQDAKEAGIISGSEPNKSSVLLQEARTSVLTQLAAVQAAQAAFPIKWAVQAVQVESNSSTHPSERLGPRLFQQLTDHATLHTMAAAARLVHQDLWQPASELQPDADTTSNGPATAAATTTVTIAASEDIAFNGAVAIIQASTRRLKSGSSGGGGGMGGGGFFRRATQHHEGCPTALNSSPKVVAGVRLLAVVADYISAVLTAVQEQQQQQQQQKRKAPPSPGRASAAADTSAAADAGGDLATAEDEPQEPPAAQKLLAALHASGALAELCAAVLAAPPCPPAAANHESVDEYSAALAEVQLTLFMVLWDLSALLAAPYGSIAAELLAAPGVVQLRREALLQVAASVLVASADTVPQGGGSPSDRAASRGAARSRGTSAGSSCAVEGDKRTVADPDGAAATAVAACWPLIRCAALKRIYVARGLQFADVVHIMVDAAVGAVVVPQDRGALATAAAAAAAAQLFPSRLAATELGARVCKALSAHADRLAEKQAAAARAAAKDSAAAAAAAKTPGQMALYREAAHERRQNKHLQQQCQQQREQLADDAASVETAIRMCLVDAMPAEKAACRAAVSAMRQWVLQMAEAVRPAPRPLVLPSGRVEAGDEAESRPPGEQPMGMVAMALASDSPQRPSQAPPTKETSSSRRRGGCGPNKDAGSGAVSPTAPVATFRALEVTPRDGRPLVPAPAAATLRSPQVPSQAGSNSSSPHVPAALVPSLAASPVISPCPHSPFLHPTPANNPQPSPASPETLTGEITAASPGPDSPPGRQPIQSPKQAQSEGPRKKKLLPLGSIRLSIVRLRKWVSARSP